MDIVQSLKRVVLYTIAFLSYHAKRVVGECVAWNYDRVTRRIEANGIGTIRRALVAHLPPRAVVLEIGAGTGATVASGAYDSSPNAPQRVVLVEPDCDMRKRMERKLRASGLTQRVTAELTVVDAALPNLPCSDAEFDAVVMCFVTSHLPRRLESLKEVFRVLRPGGVLAILDHGAHPDGHTHHCHKDSHRKEQSGSSETRENSVLFWFREWLRFQWVVRLHQHKHGDTGLSFDPIVNDITQAGFETETVKTIQTEGTGISILSKVLFAVAKKPVNVM